MHSQRRYRGADRGSAPSSSEASSASPLSSTSSPAFGSSSPTGGTSTTTRLSAFVMINGILQLQCSLPSEAEGKCSVSQRVTTNLTVTPAVGRFELQCHFYPSAALHDFNRRPWVGAVIVDQGLDGELTLPLGQVQRSQGIVVAKHIPNHPETLTLEISYSDKSFFFHPEEEDLVQEAEAVIASMIRLENEIYGDSNNTNYVDGAGDADIDDRREGGGGGGIDPMFSTGAMLTHVMNRLKETELYGRVVGHGNRKGHYSKSFLSFLGRHPDRFTIVQPPGDDARLTLAARGAERARLLGAEGGETASPMDTASPQDEQESTRRGTEDEAEGGGGGGCDALFANARPTRDDDESSTTSNDDDEHKAVAAERGAATTAPPKDDDESLTTQEQQHQPQRQPTQRNDENADDDELLRFVKGALQSAQDGHLTTTQLLESIKTQKCFTNQLRPTASMLTRFLRHHPSVFFFREDPIHTTIVGLREHHNLLLVHQHSNGHHNTNSSSSAGSSTTTTLTPPSWALGTAAATPVGTDDDNNNNAGGGGGQKRVVVPTVAELPPSSIPPVQTACGHFLTTGGDDDDDDQVK